MTRWAERRVPHGSVLEAGAPRTTVVLLAVLALTSMLLVLLSRSVVMACLPLVALVVVYGIWRLPLRTMLLGLLMVGLLVDNPGSRPFTDKWRTLLSPVGEYLYDNLNNHLPLQMLRFSGLDALIILLVSLLAVRMLFRQSVDRRAGASGGASALTIGLVALFGTVLWLEVWGIGRGGDIKNSLWQLRQLLWLPVLAGLFTYALRGPRDFLVVARTIIGAACVKAGLGIYFVYVIMRAQGIRPAHATTHDDTVLFVTAIAICLAAYVHRPSRGHLVLVMTVVPWLMLGIVANDRRIAYVSLAGSIAVIYVLLRGPVKRVITRCALLAAPLLVVYVLMGQHRNSGIFAPAAKIMSVIMQKDASSGTRDIENYNLVQTLKHGPLLGSGWGHEYLELSKGNDISEAFPQYRYIAHNSILWLWSISGVVGFTLLWMCVPITIFLATRSYDRARSPFERTAAASVIAAMVIWMVQAWGDMGTQSWPGIVMISCLLAVGAKLAVATGAWPARVTVVHRPRIAFAIAARLSTSIPQAAP